MNRAKTRSLTDKVRESHLSVTLSALWLAGPIRPAEAWRLVATLRTALGGEMAPVAFRTESGGAQRRLTLRADAVVVERLSTGGPVELLRRAGQATKVVLRSRASIVTLCGPRLSSLPEVMAFVTFIKQIYDVLHPIAGVVDVVRETEERSQGIRSAEVAATVVAQMDQPPSGWLTILGPDRVERVGAARLLMAPVFLIEMLSDGGLLVVETPVPREVGRSAVRRSTVLSDQLQRDGAGPSGAPVFLEQSVDDLVRSGFRPSKVSDS